MVIFFCLIYSVIKLFNKASQHPFRFLRLANKYFGMLFLYVFATDIWLTRRLQTVISETGVDCVSGAGGRRRCGLVRHS